jgi:AraC family transcriptional regulator, transcriptional activator of the genes for pyochelin and ferripyochelin receptors
MSTGEVRATFSGKNAVDISSGNGAFHFDPVMDEEHLLYSDTPTQTTAFEIASDYLTQLLFELDETERGPLTQLKDSILRGEFIHFPFPATVLHERIVSDIDNCPLNGTMGNLMLEGSLQQLIALQFSALCTPKRDHRGINSCDKEIMFGMKEYITANFNDNHSIATLSRRFGINQTKLKKYFKELFGVPVIEFIFNLRMDHAQTLLYDRGMYIADVAPIAGYKNPNHFATAFRRKFGVSPSEIRKRG